MMHLRWLLLVFVLNFILDPIKADNSIYHLRWYVAKTTFDYLKTNENGTDEITPHTDNILMVAVGDGHIIGSAQVQCRHIKPPIEQIVNTMATTEYFPFDFADLYPTKKFTYQKQCYHDMYGCISLVHNFCHIVHHDVPADFTRAENNAVIKKDSVKPTVGEKLIAVFIEEGPKLKGKIVKVVDFEECKKLFDPDNVYTVDPEEQLCTERVLPDLRKAELIAYKLVDDPIALPSALFFRFDMHVYELVGIESKSKEELSLLTWVPYQCRNKNVPCL